MEGKFVLDLSSYYYSLYCVVTCFAEHPPKAAVSAVGLLAAGSNKY